MATFPSLNTNEFYAALYNAYSLVKTLADGRNFDDGLAAKYREEGGMYGDQLVYTDMDILYAYDWDHNDTNVLAPNMRVKPTQQAIVIDQMKQIGLYTDEYLSKRAWMTSEKYDQFKSVVEAMIGNTKKVFDEKLLEVYIGTHGAAGADQTFSADVTTAVGAATGEEASRIEAQTIAKTVGDVFVALNDASNKFNDNGFVKRFSEEEFDIIWNAASYNKILYTDLPTIYHKDNLLKNGKVLPAHYFGTVVSAATTANGTTHRAAEDCIVLTTTAAGTTYSDSGTFATRILAGDLLPAGTPILAPATANTYKAAAKTVNGVSTTIRYNLNGVHAYTADDTIVCRIVHKNGLKFASSFETSTEFFNAKNLSKNFYLTWCFAKPEYLKGYPYITVTQA